MSDDERVAYQEVLLNLQEIIEGWEWIERGHVPHRELTPWEKERLMFARDAVEKVNEVERQNER